MNWIIAAISVMSVMFFAVPELLDSSTEQSSNSTDITALTISESALKQDSPSLLLTQLQNEADSIKRQQLAEQKQAESKNKKTAAENELVFGDQVFHLLGIFNQQNKVFVIIKNDQQQLVKATLGDTLGGNVKLIAVTNNTITLANETQTKEFKLFQRQSHEQSPS
ncbi:hypothetical protein [Pseudoalteromonas sp. L1]|uniref:hypothetical protein n=1 Tax=Pseudoalteromonas sp. L1 TaxID=195716 RepID=UPI001F487D1B|nr:hypothetical protein [Pseudoalteromonas sp. L1]